jgi:cytoskeleton protein RodZ
VQGASGEAPEGRLELELAGQAWVEVRDKHGDVLISRTLPAKSKQTVRGELPFTVRVGNASAVSVMLDGRPVDLMPYTRNEIAKLVLPSPRP